MDAALGWYRLPLVPADDPKRTSKFRVRVGDDAEASGAACQSIEPAGTIHSVRWPVTLAIRSKSAS